MTTQEALRTLSTSDDGRVLRILIVEDSADGAESMAMLLRLWGYQVRIARDGPKALEIANIDDPDVVLLDLGLPGMSGYQVARSLTRSRPQKTPLVIAVTGYGRDEDKRRSAEARIDLHLVKPVDPEVLCCTLARFQRLIDERPEQVEEHP